MTTTKKTRYRTVAVVTIDGEKLQLKRDRLTQVAEPGVLTRDMACYVTFANIRKAVPGGAGLRVSFVEKRTFEDCQYVDVTFSPNRGQLGCCVFDEKTFNKIMRAARCKARYGDSGTTMISD